MLKRNGILHPSLNHALAQLGHGDRFVVADAGLPIPPTVRRIDLAFAAGIPRLIDTLPVILDAIVVDSVMLAEEINQAGNSDLFSQLMQHLRQKSDLDPSKMTYIPHAQFKAELPNMRFIVRTGETTPFANVMLQSGVFFG